MATEEEGDPIHPHCLNCVNVAKCSARLERRTSCPIVHCKLECGASFHACKCQEHQLLCPNVKVPCANAVNGCPVWLLRSQLGSHLQHCPASLVYCTAEWNRWGWLRSATGDQQCVDRSGKLQLDFALAMRDLRSLRDSGSHRGKLNKGGNKDDAMPVAAAPRGVGTTGNAWCLYNGGSCTSSSDGVDSHATGRLNGYVNHVCETSCVKAREEEKTNRSDVDFRLMRAAGACFAAKHGVGLNVELCVEFLTRYQLKPDKVYTFSCCQVFRRDEYAWHYQNVHRDIHCGLNGWLEHRCPLAQYGCSFSRRMFHPSPSGSQLVYSEVLESFGLAFPSAVEEAKRSGKGDADEGCSKNPSGTSVANSKVLESCGLAFPSAAEEAKPNVKADADKGARSCLPNGHSHTNGTCGESGDGVTSSGPAFSDSPPLDGESGDAASSSGQAFLDFPFEVLQHIAGFLDAFSLNNFSLVSKRLRDVSCSLLKSRGMVVLRWERHGKFTWRVHSKSWYFSNGFSPIRKWVFSDEEHMSSHLKQCKYFDRNIKTMPTAVCFGIGNSRGPKTLVHLAMKAPPI